MNIIEKEEAPKLIIEIAESVLPDITIIFGIDKRVTQGKCGVCIPKKKTIVIDMRSCLEATALIKAGMLVISAAWYNLLYTLNHEIHHAQGNEDEAEANTYAQKQVEQWSENNQVPPLNEMGWMGMELKMLLNHLYKVHPKRISLEIDAIGKAAATAKTAAAMRDFDYTETQVLIDAIREGYVGAMINKIPCLSANEFFTLGGE